MQYDRKLDADVASAIMSINAIKGVEIGNGFASSESFGSQVHDEIFIKGENFSRKTNRAGGIEGGITTGMPIIVTAAMKPIATISNFLLPLNLWVWLVAVFDDFLRIRGSALATLFTLLISS